MKLFLNVFFAWVSTISMIMLSIIWLIRILNKKDKFQKTNKWLRKNHINLGYVFLVSSFAHGMLSSFSVFSINYGTVTLIVGVLICYTYKFRKNMGKKWIKHHRELTILIFILTAIHIVEVNGFVGPQRIINSLKTDFKSITNTIDKSENQEGYKDGIYTGEGNGYNPGLKVQVEIKDGLINDIQILEHNEVGQMFYQPAFTEIPTQIIEKQTTDVDIVSGATYSSKGIMEAVNDALSKASIK